LGYGVPESGERCHSPMAYLSQAMNEVLMAVNMEKESRIKAEVQEHQKMTRQRVEQETRLAEEKLLEKKRTEFERAFPSQEAIEKYLVKFSKKYPALNAKGPMLLNLAIVEWNAANSTGKIGASVGANR
jgi:hypothetical protein